MAEELMEARETTRETLDLTETCLNWEHMSDPAGIRAVLERYHTLPQTDFTFVPPSANCSLPACIIACATPNEHFLAE